MTRQAFVRVLLSLLLLISQQMATTHVLSHLTGKLDKVAAAQMTADSDTALKSALAQDQSCNQCLALAQMAGPLVSSPPQLDVPHQASFAIAGIPARPVGARIILAFQSRAPPVLS